jgi:polysaccharide biosynthesis/export protein
MRLHDLYRAMRGTFAGVVVAVLVLLAAALPMHAQVPADYVLGPGDVLDVAVFGEGDLTRTLTVRPDGKISLPLIGEIIVTGLTPRQLTEKLATALQVYLKNPVVTVTVSTTRVSEQMIYLVGEVRNPGPYEMRRGWTVLEAIIQAGGVTDKAHLRRASIVRRLANQTIALDLDRLIRKGDQGANVPLEGGDVILVPELENKIMVLGGVRNAGVFDLKEGARVLDAIVAAGGPSEKAQLNSVGITRQDGERRVLLATVDVNKIIRNGDQGQNVALQHTDVVYVPETRVRWQDILSYISGFQLVRAVFGF